MSDVAILMRLTQLLVAQQEQLVEQHVEDKLHTQHLYLFSNCLVGEKVVQEQPEEELFCSQTEIL